MAPVRLTPHDRARIVACLVDGPLVVLRSIVDEAFTGAPLRALADEGVISISPHVSVFDGRGDTFYRVALAGDTRGPYGAQQRAANTQIRSTSARLRGLVAGGER